MKKKILVIGSRAGKAFWRFIKSDKAIATIKVIAAGAALVHAIEEFRKANRTVGFKK